MSFYSVLFLNLCKPLIQISYVKLTQSLLSKFAFLMELKHTTKVDRNLGWLVGCIDLKGAWAYSHIHIHIKWPCSGLNINSTERSFNIKIISKYY